MKLEFLGKIDLTIKSAVIMMRRCFRCTEKFSVKREAGESFIDKAGTAPATVSVDSKPYSHCDMSWEGGL
jgi:hypothetical protein